MLAWLVLFRILGGRADAEDTPVAAPVEPTPAAPVAPPPVPGEVVEIWGDPQIATARAQLYQTLKEEGYRKGVHQDDRTVFRSYSPWKPQVIVHDDGWVYLKRQPPRVHSPGKSFSDQGSPASYLWCVLAPTACVSVGGWMVSKAKYQAVEADVLDATHADVNKLNEAVARKALSQRINTDIPADLERIWKLELPAAERRALIFEFWDTRLDDAAGDAARDAVEAYALGVIQGSDEPYSAAELAELNARRHVARVFLAPRTSAPGAP